MGIVNVTPDSFYKSSRINQVDELLQCVENMINNGAAIIDVGGQSTRPGSKQVSAEVELQRIIPAINESKFLLQ